MKERFKMVSAVYLILEDPEGKILFGLRQNTGYCDGEYGLPAGHVDGGESLKQACIREAKEEIGIDISENDLEMVHVMHRLNPKEHERLDFYFTVAGYQGELTNTEPDKCKSLDWLDITQNHPIMEHSLDSLRQWKAGKNYSDLDFH
jgi:8-oxo-dGTP diphosphatase